MKPGLPVIGLAAHIAHYNYTLRFRSCGLFRGTYGSALRTRSRLCPDTPARTFSPMQPDQRVTLSLGTPLGASPQDLNPLIAIKNYGKGIGQHTPVQNRAERGA